MTTQEQKSPAQVIAELGLSVESVFVPFSQSRNKGNSHVSLNWIVTIKRGGRDILKTEYSAGAAHCPGYQATRAPATFVATRYRARSEAPGGWSYRAATRQEALAQFRDEICRAECESGVAMELDPFGRGPGNNFKVKRARAMIEGRAIMAPQKIEPNALDVIYSLSMDSSVLDYATFEQWAPELGIDPDSRQGEKVYRACLEIALAMRGAIGEKGLSELSDAFQDY